MPLPSVPGESDDELVLSCGAEIDPYDLDMGMREYECDCGETHAVVMDVHPLGRFIPEFLVETLRETITTDDDFEEFSMPHAIAMIREEYPDEIAAADLSGDGHVGYGLVWMTDFDSRELHETVVAEVVDLMEHAISHADDGPTVQEFEQQLEAFELETFVDAYRAERDFESEYDTAP